MMMTGNALIVFIVLLMQLDAIKNVTCVIVSPKEIAYLWRN